MIIVYRDYGVDFLSVQRELNNQGLQVGVDWRFENAECFKCPHIREGIVYTSSAEIAEHYSYVEGVEVREIP